MLTIAGKAFPLRPTLGLLAQPFSCIGLPVATVPVFGRDPLPVGVQLVAPPWREEDCVQTAHRLEEEGAAIAYPPSVSLDQESSGRKFRTGRMAV